VVTLSVWDDANDPSPFTLGSSYPTTCARAVAFRDVLVAGKLYTAEIDGYQLPAGSLAPFGESSSGARQMLDIESGEPVAPRWQTHCGHDGGDATLAAANEVRFVTSCDPLSDETATAGTIVFPPGAALGADPCATAASIDIQPDDPSLPAVTALGCDASPVTYDQGIADGRGYGFYVTAERDGVALGTECFAVARAGLAVTPLCNAISSMGDVRVSLDGLAAGDHDLCPAGYGFDLALDGDVLNPVPLPCGTAAQVGSFAPGELVLEATVLDDAAEPTGDTASCTASVLAGTTVAAECIVQ
jgi:hypothetical protein